MESTDQPHGDEEEQQEEAGHRNVKTNISLWVKEEKEFYSPTTRSHFSLVKGAASCKVNFISFLSCYNVILWSVALIAMAT